MAARGNNVETTYKFLLGKGLSPAQAAGVVGGLSGESGTSLSTTAENPNSHAFGIGQWLGDRKTALMQRPNPTSLGTQLDFLWSELQGAERAAYNKLKGTHSIDEATKAWVSGFERPEASGYHLDTRSAFGREVFNRLKGVGGASPSPEDALMGGGADAGAASAGGESQGLNAGVAALLAAGQQQKPVIQSAGIAAPAFSARPATPSGYAPVQGGGGPVAQGPNVDSLLALVAGQGQGGGQASPDTASPDAASPNTGPASEGTFGKSHSPLLELIHKGDKPYAVKNGKVVDPGFYSEVWDNHADHVHVAAGPKTVVQIGELAQKMGLSVGENPHFGGVEPVHSKNSYHYKGEAIDVSGDPRKMNQFAARVERLYGLGG